MHTAGGVRQQDMSTKRPRRRASTRPGLTYRGIDVCDRCGAPLQPAEGISGICHRHRNREGKMNTELVSVTGWPEPDLSGNLNNGTVTGAVQADGPPVGVYGPK